MPPLRKIATITLAGTTFDLARNGVFCLVENKGPDAYGNPVARVVPAEEFVAAGSALALSKFGAARLQALVDLVGDLTVRLQGRVDLQLAAGGAEE